MINPLIIVTALAAQSTAPATSTAPPAETAASPTASSLGTSSYVDLEGGAGYSTNPNLRFGSDTGAAFGRVSIHGVHTRISDRTTTVLSAFGQNVFYTNHYGSQQSLDLNGRHDARVSEKLRLFGDVDFGYDKGGQLDTRIIGVPNVPLPPGVVEPPVLLPPGSDFLSVTGRQYRASGHAGAQVTLGPRDSLTATSGVEYSKFKGGVFDTHYVTIPVSVGYERQISPRTTIGARVVASNTEYNGPASVREIRPELTIHTLLTERLVFTGAAGVGFASIDDGVNTRHSTGLTANAALCSNGERSQFCAHAAVDQESPTAAGPARTVLVGVDYSHRLDADQTIRFSVDANRYSSPTSFIAGQTFSHATYVRGAADYTRRISDRWFGGANVAARKLTERGPDPKTDVSGSLFIRYRLGDLR